MDDPVKVMLVSGSIRTASHTRTLTAAVDRLLAESGALTVHWNLQDSPLPFADPLYHRDPSQNPDKVVREFAACATACDAFVWSSPVYHNSYSAVLKNALDHLNIPCFWYKPVALLSHGGNRSSQAVDHLRIVVRGLNGVALPSQVCTADGDYVEAGGGYEIQSEEIQLRIRRVAAELMNLSYAFTSVRNFAIRPSRQDQQ